MIGPHIHSKMKKICVDEIPNETVEKCLFYLSNLIEHEKQKELGDMIVNQFVPEDYTNLVKLIKWLIENETYLKKCLLLAIMEFTYTLIIPNF